MVKVKKPERKRGWQVWVDVYDDHVIKTPQTKEEIKEKITKHLRKHNRLNEREAISTKLLEDTIYSIRLIKKSKLPRKYLAYSEFLEDGTIKQKKVVELGTLLKKYTKNKDMKSAKRLIDRFIAFVLKLWEYGIHEKPLKLTSNFGVLNNHLVMIDFLELTSNKRKIKAKLNKKNWGITQRLSKKGYDDEISDYFIEQAKKYLNGKYLDKHWKKRVKG